MAVPLSRWLYLCYRTSQQVAIPLLSNLSAGDCTSTIEPLSRWLHLYYRTSQKVAIPPQVAILRLSNFSAGGYTSPNQTCQQVAIPLISTRGYTSPMKPVSRWLYLSYQHVAIPLLSNLPAGGFTSPMEPLSTWLYLAYLTYQQVAIPRLSNLSTISLCGTTLKTQKEASCMLVIIFSFPLHRHGLWAMLFCFCFFVFKRGDRFVSRRDDQ